MKMKKILIVVLALITVFTFSGTAFASGNIDAKQYSYSGTILVNSRDNQSRDEITSLMGYNGALYANYTKALA
jgi:uncharacterized protein YxeA